MIIIAVIYAIFIKKPEANDDENEKQLEDGEEWLHTHLTEDDLKNPDKMRELEKLKSTAPLPPELDFLKTAREERSVYILTGMIYYSTKISSICCLSMNPTSYNASKMLKAILYETSINCLFQLT